MMPRLMPSVSSVRASSAGASPAASAVSSGISQAGTERATARASVLGHPDKGAALPSLARMVPSLPRPRPWRRRASRCHRLNAGRPAPASPKANHALSLALSPTLAHRQKCKGVSRCRRKRVTPARLLSVAVVVGLVGALDRHADIICLVLLERGELGADLAEMEPRHLLIELVGR